MSELWYDSEEDVLGIQLTDKKYWKSVEVSENVVVDLSRDGEIAGIEIFKARPSFKKDAPLIVSKVTGKPK
jgi:uncharacterized protein YuzE